MAAILSPPQCDNVIWHWIWNSTYIYLLSQAFSVSLSTIWHLKHALCINMCIITWGLHWWQFDRKYYSDVIISEMASQITSLTIVYATVYSGRSKKTSKLRVTGLCARNLPATGEFHAQRPVTRQMFPFDDVIMCIKMMPFIFTIIQLAVL